MFDPFFAWLESTAFSIWMRESPSIFSFPMILAVHTIGLGLLAGINVALDLRMLGFAPRVPIAEFGRLWPFLWLGLWMNALSGVALLAAYPTKALTNPFFYTKLAFIGAALVILRAIRRFRLTDDIRTPIHARWSIKTLAIASMVCWAAAIAAGRFLAYTYIRLMVDSTPVPRPWMP